MFAYNARMSLPTALYSVAQVRAFDAHAIATQGAPGIELMRRAGTAAVALLRQHWPAARRVAVVCGAGNNGGDGYVVAQLLRAAALEVRLQALVPVSQLTGDARRAADAYLMAGGSVASFDADDLKRADLIVDAILGTGFKPPLRPAAVAAIEAINASGQPVLALDLPSGLDADTGQVAELAVRATATISFVALKQGLVLGAAAGCVGELHCDDLGVRLPEGAAARPALMRLDTADIAAALPPRARTAHKGDAGRVLVIGGNTGMPGAVLLAGEAALRAGAGLVRVATRPEHAHEIVVGRPELMCSGIDGATGLQPLLEVADVAVIGPGLGRNAWARELFSVALAAGKPLVIDADALNLLAEQPELALPAGSILTPHPGEAGRLLGASTTTVQADRMGALRRLQQQFTAVIVLKGSGTLVGAAGHVPAICIAGNPGMATAGMGDVLAGATAAILAQCRDSWRAACAAVYAHAIAGDALAARIGQRGLLASELAAALTPILNRVAT
jgi:ADP-dependent NAD(P)H-hydrate dehydratase / NAD(P)H-hydrate epimerase